jgi:magnesium-protoporphyrin O-methyltransferase
LHLALLQRGAASAHEVDISSAYIAEAQSLARKLNLGERVTHQRADFAQEAASVTEAEVVVLHRVVCCYPDMPRLLTQAANHARRVLAFSFPWDGWPVRLGERAFGLWFALTRSDYRFYIHRWRDMQPLVAEAGFTLVQRTSSFPWQIVVWERRGK